MAEVTVGQVAGIIAFIFVAGKKPNFQSFEKTVS